MADVLICIGCVALALSHMSLIVSFHQLSSEVRGVLAFIRDLETVLEVTGDE